MTGLDWQFAVVTLVALGAIVVLARRLTSAFSVRRKPGADPACAHCATAESPRPVATDARTVTTPVVSLHDLRESARR